MASPLNGKTLPATTLAAVLLMGGYQTVAGGHEAELKEVQGTVDAIYQMHDRYDNDGVPLWYVPRSWGTTQEEVLDVMKDIRADIRDLKRIMGEESDG